MQLKRHNTGLLEGNTLLRGEARTGGEGEVADRVKGSILLVNFKHYWLNSTNHGPRQTASCNMYSAIISFH